jgi:uncharacterized protein YuzE
MGTTMMSGHFSRICNKASMLLGWHVPEGIVSKKQDIRAEYDPEADTLYASVGAPVAAVSVEVDAGIYIRVVPATGQVVGLEVFDCSAHGFVRRSSPALFAEGLLSRFSEQATNRVRAERANSRQLTASGTL